MPSGSCPYFVIEEYLETKTVAIAARGAGGPKLGSS